MQLKDVHIHIGKHKTGTTSFQSLLKDHAEALRLHGIGFLPMHLSALMVAVCIRQGLDIPPIKRLHSERIEFSRDCLIQKLRDFVANRSHQKVVISNEHFSYFRTQCEVDRLLSVLKSALGVGREKVAIHVVLRQKDEWLNSYRSQIVNSGLAPSRDKNSPYYCGRDSWLVDDEAIVELWKENFSNFSLIQYDSADVVSKLILSMNLPVALEQYSGDYRTNLRKRGVRSTLKNVIPIPVLTILRRLRKWKGRV